jgi:hypothetical protein
MTTNELNQTPTAKLLALFAAAQDVQKRNRPDSDAWQMASVAIHALAPVIAERGDR